MDNNIGSVYKNIIYHPSHNLENKATTSQENMSIHDPDYKACEKTSVNLTLSVLL